MLASVLAMAMMFGQGAQTGQAQLTGAGKLLEGLKAGGNTPGNPGPFESLHKEMDAYNARSASLTVQAAADGWVKLLVTWEAANLNPSDGRNSDDQSPEVLVSALPRPEAWPAIRTALAKRPDSDKNKVLVMLFDLLLGDLREVIRKGESMRKPAIEGMPEEMDFEDEAPLKIELPLALRLGDAALAEKLLVRAARSRMFFNYEGIPDLVGPLGAEKATPVLRKMLEAATASFDKINGKESRKLARSILLSNLDKFKTPQWSLAEGPEALEIILKFVKKFGVPKPDSEGSVAAISIYANHLVESGKIDDALRLLSSENARYSLGFETFPLDKQRQTRLFDGMSQILDRAPTTDIWDAYLALSKALARLPEAVARLNAALAATNLKPVHRAKLLTHKAKLAAESGDEGAAIALAIEASKLPPETEYRNEAAEALLGLSRATGSREAADAAIEAIFKQPSSSYSADSVFSVLVAQGRFADAQRFELRRASTSNRYQESGLKPETPLLLAELYYLADRPDDVVELLDSYPSWSADDLFQLLAFRQSGYSRPEFWPRPLGFFAGWAFAKTGRKELAVRTLHDLLSFDLTQDDAYELLNELEGAPALAFYDELTRTDPFEPRPLFWKADLLRSLGRLPEAETLARAAVALDPTDGQSPAGHRLASYAVLGKILRAKGENKEAETFERIVQAVRLAEKGDLYRDAGLLPQAAALYRESGGVFADAYCVHVRMAATLAEQGKTQEALEQYERAYELMPDSFGRIESLCWGCGNEFKPDIARKVFERLAKELPTKPQVHYLLGLLHSQVGESAAALASFETAVKLDPDYVNAWKGILELADEGGVGKESVQRAALSLIRLDPMALHGGYQAVNHVFDFAALYRMFASVYASLPPAPAGPLYPLHKQEERGMGFGGFFNRNGGPGGSDVRKGPGGGLTTVGAIREICQLYQRNQ